ncbi:MAG: DNA-processing protein DprA [Clostridium sp.]|jgi:DNA processing protein
MEDRRDDRRESCTGNRREREYAYWLSRVEAMGAVNAKKLYAYTNSFEAIYNMKKDDLNRLEFLSERQKESLLTARTELEKRMRELEQMGETGMRMILLEDEAYPSRLKNLYDPPMWLFVLGQLPDDTIPSVSIVGARSCTAYGRQEAEYFGKFLAEHGIQIVSGMALGVDLAGHRGALKGGGNTFAVLGCGADVCYPPSGKGVYEAIKLHGGILSEYGPGEPPLSFHFPVRNRIISGLSDLVLVVEARKRSGSLITADLALEQGKEVMALPGRRIDPLSAGCNRLIRQGAGILTDPEELLEFFHIKSKNLIKVHGKSGNALAKTEKMVYSCLDSHPRHVDEIVRATGLGAGGCMTALLNLEMNGWIVQPMNQYYMRKLE